MSDGIERQARELLDGAVTTALQKKLGATLDQGGSRAMREAVIDVAASRGIVLAEDAVTWPGKKLLRRAQGREKAARERRNPIRRDEAFQCVACGEEVAPHGRTARDHCPSCLCSLHVDNIPGDRAAACGGVLRPISLEMRGGHPYLLYRCEACGVGKVNQAILDGERPDSWERIMKLSAKEG
jgi:hypothetical protein